MRNPNHPPHSLISAAVFGMLLLASRLPGYGQAPTAPTNFRITGQTETTIDVAWDAATDDGAVIGYIVETGNVAPQLPVADASVQGGNARNENFGDDTSLIVKDENNESYVRWSYLKFDISQLPSSFSSALLRLHVASASATDQHSIYSVANTSWTEKGIKWSNKPAISSEPLATWTTVAQGDAVDVDLTAAIQAERAAGRDVFSVAITSAGFRFIKYASREAENESSRPQLLVSGGEETVGTTTGATRLTLTGLEAGRRYRLGVRAQDEDGNVSELSNTVEVITVPTGQPRLFEAEGLVAATSEFPKVVTNNAASGNQVVINNFTTTFVSLSDLYGFGNGAYVFTVGYRSSANLRKSLQINGSTTTITLPNSSNRFVTYRQRIQLDSGVFNAIRLLTDFGDEQGGEYDFFRLEPAADVIPSNPTVDNDADLFGWDYANDYPSTEFYEYSLDGGAHWFDAPANPLNVGDSVYAVGQIQVRVKADPATGRPAGLALLSNAAYSISSPPPAIASGTVLWRLGQDNRSAAEFAEYGTSPVDSITVPADWRARTDWSGVAKGLKLDQTGTLVVRYSLSEVPANGVRLRFRILDAHRVVPQLNVFSNEVMAGLIQMVGLEGSDVALDFVETYQLYVPKEFLQVGENHLRLSLDRGLYADETGDGFHRFVWDYLVLESMDEPATEPIHGRYVHMGNDFRADDASIKARTAFLLSKWSGIAYSGNWIRAGITIEQSSLTDSRRAYLETLKQLNFNAMPLLFTTNFINYEAATGSVSAKGVQQFENYLKNYGDLLTAVEVSNEPGLFNTPQAGNVAVTQMVLDKRPTFAPQLKVVAPGWAYWPSNGTPNGWARDPQQRRPIELLADLTNGHSYTTSGTQGIGGSLAETLLTYQDFNGDAFPKPMAMSETGGNDNAADREAYGTKANRFAAVFDREMRGNIGYVDHIMYHGDYSPGIFALFDYPGDLDDFNPRDAIAHPNQNEPQNPRLKTYRRLALAYATHGAPLPYEYLNREALAGKKAYFRAVNTATLGRSATGGESDKVLINFTNFDTEPLTMQVRVMMPEGAQYAGERFGAGSSYSAAYSQTTLSPAGDHRLTLTETLGPGEAVQYILSTQETSPPSAPTELVATTQDFKQINVDWEPSTDNVAVAGYNIYRDNELINVVPASVTFYADKSLGENTAYTYTTEAFDDVGNVSARSAPAVASSDTIPTTPGGPKYEAEDCIPPGVSAPRVKNESGASGGKIVWNNFFTTKCKIFGVVAQQEDYVLTLRYRSPRDAARRLLSNEELNIKRSSVSVSLPKTNGSFRDAQQQIKLVPGEKNIITILTQFGQDQAVEYDYFVLEPGTLPEPVAEWKTVDHSNSALLYSSGFSENQAGTAHEASSAGESATFTFEGTGIRWYSNVVADYGQATILLDGVPVDTVSVPEAAFEGPDKLVLEITGLEEGIHTIEIVSQGSATITLTKLQYLGTKDILLLPGPDVIVQDIKTIPADPKGGEAVTFVAEVKNIGTLPTPAGTITGIGFSVNGGGIGFSDNFTAAIQPNEVVAITQTSAPWTAPTDEVVEVQAFVDDINRYRNQAGVNEQSRANNLLKKNIFFASSGTVSDEITISSPTSDSLLGEGDTVLIQVEVLRDDISQVLFYAGNNLLGEAASAPYAFTWLGIEAGTYALTARAETTSGTVLRSRAIVLSIAAGQPDLVVTDIRWEPEYPTLNDGVRFAAVVTNQGTGVSPNNTIMSVKFRVNGRLVTWSNTYFGGLSAGESVTVEAVAGVVGSAFWRATTVGSVAVEATVDEENRIFETDEANNSLVTSLEVRETAPTVSPLNLTSMCSPDPETNRRWRIRNPNGFAVQVAWQGYGTEQAGTLRAPAGDSFFVTATVGNANTVKISWKDGQGRVQNKVKASTGAPCPDAGNAARMMGQVAVFPNPARNALNLRYSNGNPLVQEIYFTDMLGRRYPGSYQKGSGNTIVVSVASLRTGLYLLHTTINNQRFIERITVEE